MKLQLPQEIIDLTKKISQLPKQYDTLPHGLLVGGFVRDLLLGLKPKDTDIEVYGVDYGNLKQLLERLFPHRVVEAGKSFGVFKIRLSEFEIDIALPRTESKSGTGHKEFVVSSNPELSIEEALRRRDFTINAISLDPLTQEVIDPFGGQKDLHDKVLRVVNPKTFTEDPLRVYRAMQFVARFGLSVEAHTQSLMKSMVESGELETLSKERITEEWKKLLLKSSKPSLGLALIKDLGIIERYFPELHALTKTDQEPEWHPEGNVWNHSLLTVDVTAGLIKTKKYSLTEAERLTTLLGGLLHDIGKPEKTKFEDGRIRSRGHDEAGKKIARQFLSKFIFGSEINTAVQQLVAEHMRPRQLFASLQKTGLSQGQYTNAVRRLVKRIYPTSWKALILVSEADLKGRARDDFADPFPAGDEFAKTVVENSLEESIKAPLISGADIIHTAALLDKKILPGPLFTKLIKTIEDQRDSGAIQTKSEALDLLRSKIEKLKE